MAEQRTADPYDCDLAYEIAATLLVKCSETSMGRALDHGGVTAEWTMTAEIWSKLVGKEIKPYEAMAMMTANKLVRLMLAPKEDHFLDGANYLALAWGVLNTSDKD